MTDEEQTAAVNAVSGTQTGLIVKSADSNRDVTKSYQITYKDGRGHFAAGAQRAPALCFALVGA